MNQALYNIITDYKPRIKQCAWNCFNSWNRWDYMHQQANEMYQMCVQVGNMTQQLTNLSQEDQQYKDYMDQYCYNCGQAALNFMNCAQNCKQGNIQQGQIDFNNGKFSLGNAAPSQANLDAAFPDQAPSIPPLAP